MGISINTNVAATRAGVYLGANHANLQKSLDRLSSGKRITEPADDAGGLAVSMKLEHVGKVLRGTSHNIANAISLLQVQDGVLDSAGKIVSRMGELQGMSMDVTKNATDIDNYEAEFNDLRSQLWDMTKTEFNSIALFGDWNRDDTSTVATAANAVFGTNDNHADVSLDVIISEDGTTSANIHRSKLGSALMVGADGTGSGVLAAATGLAGNTGTLTLDWRDAGRIQAAAFTQALQNIATLRATNGGQVQRLQYAMANVETQITNIGAANGRIMDVDIAAESSNLARQQVLVQASAAMTAQANMSNDVALMLLQ
jgi:flagellin